MSLRHNKLILFVSQKFDPRNGRTTWRGCRQSNDTFTSCNGVAPYAPEGKHECCCHNNLCNDQPVNKVHVSCYDCNDTASCVNAPEKLCVDETKCKLVTLFDTVCKFAFLLYKCIVIRNSIHPMVKQCGEVVVSQTIHANNAIPGGNHVHQMVKMNVAVMVICATTTHEIDRRWNAWPAMTQNCVLMQTPLLKQSATAHSALRYFNWTPFYVYQTH